MTWGPTCSRRTLTQKYKLTESDIDTLIRAGFVESTMTEHVDYGTSAGTLRIGGKSFAVANVKWEMFYPLLPGTVLHGAGRRYRVRGLQEPSDRVIVLRRARATLRLQAVE